MGYLQIGYVQVQWSVSCSDNWCLKLVREIWVSYTHSLSPLFVSLSLASTHSPLVFLALHSSWSLSISKSNHVMLIISVLIGELVWQCVAWKTTSQSSSTKQTKHPHIYINGTAVEKVESFKFLGIHITDKLKWTTHTDSVKPLKCCFSSMLRVIVLLEGETAGPVSNLWKTETGFPQEFPCI